MLKVSMFKVTIVFVCSYIAGINSECSDTAIVFIVSYTARIRSDTVLEHFQNVFGSSDFPISPKCPDE